MDDYLAGLPADQRDALERVRAVVAETAPGAEEGRSYGMPAYLYEGRPLLGFRAAKNHLSIFPFSPRRRRRQGPARRLRARELERLWDAVLRRLVRSAKPRPSP